MAITSRWENFIRTASVAKLQQELRNYLSLLQVNEQIISSLDYDLVLEAVLRVAVENTQAENASIFLINKEKEVLEFAATTDRAKEQLKTITVPLGHGISGQVAQTGEIINIAEVHQNPNFYDKVDQQTGHTTKSYLCAPLKLRGEIIGTTQLINKNGGTPFTESDERFMDFFTNQAALAIETARLLQDSLEKQSLEKELQLAHDIQASILPQKKPTLPGFEIIGSSIPARTVGGDYFNYFPFTASQNKPGLLIVIADVSGKGIPASLIVSKLDGALQLLLPLYHNLEQLMAYLNNFLYKDLIQGSFLSLFIAYLDPESNYLKYINCGHNPPFLFSPNSPQKIRELKRSGPILGIQSDLQYPQLEIPFAPGELLVLFSDGIVEAQDPQLTLYGEPRLQETITTFLQKTTNWPKLTALNELENQIWHSIHSFKQGAPINDDATLLLISRVEQKKV